MTQDEIIEMAKQAEITVEAGGKSYEQLLRIVTHFANLVAQHEREACAKLAENTKAPFTATVIRARGNL
jgi:hypothetical protein